jgi:hypothetical protein
MIPALILVFCALPALAQIQQPKPERRPTAPVVEPDPGTAEDKPLPPDGSQGGWVDPTPFCGPLVDDAIQTRLSLARSMSRAIAKSFGCGADATLADALQLLSRAYMLADSITCPGRPSTQDALMDTIRNDSDLNAALKNYVGYRVMTQGLKLNQLSDADVVKLGQDLSGSTFYLMALVDGYSPSIEIQFLDGGQAHVQEINSDGVHIDTFVGHWTISLQTDPVSQFFKFPVVELHVHGRVEHLIVEGESAPYWSSVRLRRQAGTKPGDQSGWANEVRACAQ